MLPELSFSDGGHGHLDSTICDVHQYMTPPLQTSPPPKQRGGENLKN